MAVTESVKKIALERAPAVLDFLKKNAPDLLTKAKDVFAQSSGGGDLIVEAHKAVAAGDYGMVRAVYDQLIRAGVKYDRLNQVMGISAQQLAAFVNTVEAVVAKDIAAVEAAVHTTIPGRPRDAAKTAELVKVCRFLDCDTDDIKALLLLLHTTTVGEINDLEVGVVSTSPLLPFIRRR